MIISSPYSRQQPNNHSTKIQKNVEKFKKTVFKMKLSFILMFTTYVTFTRLYILNIKLTTRRRMLSLYFENSTFWRHRELAGSVQVTQNGPVD